MYAVGVGVTVQLFKERRRAEHRIAGRPPLSLQSSTSEARQKHCDKVRGRGKESETETETETGVGA